MELTKRTGEMIFLVVILAALAGIMYALAPAGLYSNDEGVHYVQMKNFALNGTLDITGPGRRLGFEAGNVAGMRSFFRGEGRQALCRDTAPVSLDREPVFPAFR